MINLTMNGPWGYILLAIGVGIVLTYILYRFKGNNEYEYTDEYLETIANYRDGTLTMLANIIIQNLAMFTPEDGPKISSYQSGENISLVRMEFAGDREVSYEVDWNSNKVYLVMQKVVNDPSADPYVIKYEKKFKLTSGTVVDKDIIIKALNKWEDKIYDISKAHLEEILETVIETQNICNQLDEEQKKRLIFSATEDLCHIISKNRRCTKKEMGTIVSKMLAYILTSYKKDFMCYIYNMQSEGVDPVAMQPNEDKETIEK